MATIVATFDTVEKTLSVTKDGEAMPNVCNLYGGRKYNASDLDDDDFYIEVGMCDQDEDNDIRTYTSVRANDQGEFVAAEAKPTVADDVAAYFAEPAKPTPPRQPKGGKAK